MINRKLLKILIVILSIILFSGLFNTAIAGHKHPEKYYQEKWCTEHNGQIEYRLDDGTRVDCLTETHAIEFDFAPKWAESIGQSLYYGAKTDKTPGIVLIIDGYSDLKYLVRIWSTSLYYDLNIKTWIMHEDEGEQNNE